MQKTLRDLLSTIRWLSPDMALDALDDEARGFIEQRADELTALWQEYLGPGRELTPVRVTITRSAREAVARWTEALVEALASRAAKRESSEWINAWDAVLRHRMDAETASPLDIAYEIERWTGELERKALPLPREWQPAFNLLLPGFYTVARHVVGGAHIAAKHPERLSPWGPLVDLWARGAWPTLCPNGELIVYVPVTRNGTIVIDAEQALSATQRALLPQVLYGSEHVPPGRLGVVYHATRGSTMIVPLSNESSFSLSASGAYASVRQSSLAMNEIGARIQRTEDRYAVTVTDNADVRVNGERQKSFVLRPGQVVTLHGPSGGLLATVFYLGPGDGDAAHAPKM